MTNQKSDVFDTKLLQGYGSEATQLREQVRLSLQTGRRDCFQLLERPVTHTHWARATEAGTGR
jgi:hypothetical protein